MDRKHWRAAMLTKQDGFASVGRHEHAGGLALLVTDERVGEKLQEQLDAVDVVAFARQMQRRVCATA